MGDFRNHFSVDETDGEKLGEAHQKIGSSIHQVVKTHPVSKRKYLYINEGFTQLLVGMGSTESNRLLVYLYQHI